MGLDNIPSSSIDKASPCTVGKQSFDKAHESKTDSHCREVHIVPEGCREWKIPK